VAERLRALLDSPVAVEALHYPRDDAFSRIEGTGPMRVASFLELDGDDALRAEAQAFVTDLLNRMGELLP
jgi:hypothetical protein